VDALRIRVLEDLGDNQLGQLFRAAKPASHETPAAL
jgi:hypothetical protein